ncbi:MAG: hypothetical protein ACLQUS_05885 [Desulfobaccales bacterium]
MLRKNIFCGIITIVCLLCLASINSYGQIPTPPKSSNKPQKQSTSGQKQAKIISDATQSPMTMMVPFLITPNAKIESSDNAKNENSKPSADWWLVYVNLALVFVVAFQFIWMIRQERWMRRNVEIAKESAIAANKSANAAIDSTNKAQRSIELSEKQMVISQRAFVFVKGIHPHTFNLPKWKIISSEWASIMPKKVIIIPEWQNIGNTPTKNMRTHDNWMFFPLQYFPTGMPSDFNFPDLGTAVDIPVLIGPKATIFGSDLVISDQYIDAIIAGRGHLYIWGWAEYNDIFENTPRHRTEFCNKVIISWVDADRLRVEFRIHTKHNGSDNECYRKPSPYTPPT